MTEPQPKENEATASPFGKLWIILAVIVIPLFLDTLLKSVGLANECNMSKGGGADCIILGIEFGRGYSEFSWFVSFVSVATTSLGILAFAFWLLAFVWNMMFESNKS